LQTVDRQRPALAEASAAAEHALTLARLRYQHGLSTQLPVLAAEFAWITARRAESDLDAKALSASAALAKAVGGGWSPPQP
jgi:outer membrane protein TolC